MKKNKKINIIARIIAIFMILGSFFAELSLFIYYNWNGFPEGIELIKWIATGLMIIPFITYFLFNFFSNFDYKKDNKTEKTNKKTIKIEEGELKINISNVKDYFPKVKMFIIFAVGIVISAITIFILIDSINFFYF